jgi:hypothetical protein
MKCKDMQGNLSHCFWWFSSWECLGADNERVARVDRATVAYDRRLAETKARAAARKAQVGPGGATAWEMMGLLIRRPG